jgi:Ras-related protein Rab-1A
MVGNSAVGKSSLLLRFADDDFNENYMITIGVDFRFKSLNINNRIVKLQIWDTAGQERFRTIVNTYYKSNPHFYSDSHAVFLIFDLTLRDSFLDIRNYWINEVESYTDSNAVLVLVGNKADAERQVSTEEIQQFVQDKNLLYYETSAKSGLNVREMFVGVATVLTEKTPVSGIDKRGQGGTSL